MDFDGDQLNATLSLDIATTEQLRALAPHKSVFDLNAPRVVSKNLSIPDTVNATIANWLGSPIDYIDPDKLILMDKLLIQQ